MSAARGQLLVPSRRFAATRARSELAHEAEIEARSAALDSSSIADPSSTLTWLALGASTGGPAAIHDLLRELPSPLPLRVLIVQHIAPGFEGALVDWLADALDLDARLAFDGERPPPGSVRLAPAGAHMQVGGNGRLTLDAGTPPRNGHRPSIDALFLSLAAVAPKATAAALLTGMGSDGAEGLLALRRAGALCLAQDRASSAVYGMPHAALELGAAELALPPRELGIELARRLQRATGRPSAP